MPNVFTIQSNFSRGQLAPTLYARTDFADYYKGARVLTNCLTIPQGGALKRFGTRFIANLSTVTGSTDPDDYGIATLDYSDTQAYVAIFYPSNVIIYNAETDAVVTTVSTPYTGSENSELQFSQNSDVLVVVHSNHAPRLLVRTSSSTFTFNAATFKYYPTHDFDGGYDSFEFAISGKSGFIEVISSSAVFTTDHVGGIFTDGIGVMRLTQYVSNVAMNGFTIEDFDAISVRSGKECLVTEPAFGTTRGFPNAVSFYQDRLVLAGSPSLPQNCYLSKTNDYFNFDDSQSLDDSSFGLTVGGNRRTKINHVLGANTLLIATTDGFFTPTNNLGEAITPGTKVNMQSAQGMSNVPPVQTDNQIFIVDRGRQIIKSLDFDFTTQTFKGVTVSVTTDVLNNPHRVAVYDSPTAQDGNFVIYVNEDGTLAILTTLVEQNILGWSKHTTDGEVLNLADIKERVWFLVKRTIDGSPEIYLEELAFNYYTDSSIEFTNGSATNVITGLDHLEDKEVWVKGNPQTNGEGVFVGTFTVASGSVTVPAADAQTKFHVGLPYYPTIVPMPLNVDTQGGPTLYLPKQMKVLYVDYLNSLGIKIDDYEIPNLTFDNLVLDTYNSLQTGFYRYILLKGWDPYQTITISQASPFPFLIRSLSMEVDFDQPQTSI